MKKLGNILLKVIVMAVVFVITIFFVDKFQNRSYENLATELEDSTLPLVYVNYEGRYINCLHGYRVSVDTTLMRDAITPVTNDKRITISVDDSEAYAAGYSYELRRVSGGSLIENGELEVTDEENGYDVVDIDIRMDIDADTEYMLIFIISGNDGEDVRYYTRIVINDDYHALELLDFIDEFNGATYEVEEYEELSMLYPYMESYKEENSDEDLQMGHVTLASSYSDLTWNDTNPVIVTSIIPIIKEIDVNYAVIELCYVNMVQDEESTNYYSIKEFYRVSYGTNGNISVMNFDRYTDEYFNRSEINTTQNIYEIGIVKDGDVDYRYSSDNKKVSFVRNGQLWMYDYSQNSISLVFGFWLDDVENIRDTYDSHDINIISMDDDGNICFAVYGYMNRGEHEGKLGISLCTYDADTLLVTELLFVECDQPYDAMKDELSRLTYYDGTNFYFMLGNKISCINVEEKKMSNYVDDISLDHILVSENMEVMVYYSSDDLAENTYVTLVNFKTGQEYTIGGKAGESIICYAFKDTDLIYGVCDASDEAYTISVSSFANEDLDEDVFDSIFAYKLCIIDEDGSIIKEYEKTDNYIVDVSVEDDLIYMVRAKKSGDSFVLSSDDFITFKQDDETETVGTVVILSSDGTNKLYFNFPSNIYLSYVPNLNISKTVISEDASNMLISVDTDYARYMVYSNLGLEGIYETAGEAINGAIAVSGIVVSNNGEIVYRQSESQEYNTIASAISHYSSQDVDASLQDCIYMMLLYQGVTDISYDDVSLYSDPVEALTELGKYTGADVSGISLDLVFGYVSDGIPVISRIDDGRYVLIISYNSEAIRYYDPVLDDEVRTSRTSYEASMAIWDSELYTYIKE